MSVRDEDLAGAVKNRDRDAFRELYNRYQKPLANLLYRMTFDRELVDDLLQEVFVRVWRGAKSFRGDSKFSTFLFRIALNTAKSARRSLQARSKATLAAGRTQGQALAPGGMRDQAPDSGRTRSEELASPNPTPPEALEAAEQTRQVAEALGALPDADRAILVMSQYNGLSYAEIAEILAVPVGTVKSRVFYALRRLAELVRAPGRKER